MRLDSVIRGGLLSTADETFQADLGIADGQIAIIGRDLPSGVREIDATNRIVVPGGIDVHTHFDHYVDYIGSTNADDYESGTRAAAVGGITTIVNFAFQKAGESLRAAVERELAHAEGNAHIDYGLHIVPTDLRVKGALDEIGGLAAEGFTSVKVFTSVANYALSDADLLKVLRVATSEGLLVSVHAEDDALCRDLTDHFVSQGKITVDYLPRSRPPLAEAVATRRVSSYARALSCPVYFVHLSSAEALEEVNRSRSEGGEIYVETRPVYLFLDESRYLAPNREGNKYVCLPPLRSAENQQALWRGLRDGEIQTYATDHAPWSSHEKMDPSKPFPAIPAGVSNVQTSLGMLYAEGVKKGRLSVNQFVGVTSTSPAKLFGLWPRKGTLAVGSDADITLIDPNFEIEIKSAEMESRADYDPYDGYVGVGWPVMTISRGEIVAEGRKPVAMPGRGRLLKRSAYQRL